MRFRLFVLGACFLGLTSNISAQELKTLGDKASYTIGCQIGKEMLADGVDLNGELIAKGLLDTLAKKELLLTDAEMQEAITAFQEELLKQQEAQRAAMASEQKTKGDAFLATNKANAGVAVTASGLQYKILKAGTGPKPTQSDTVKVHYVGTLIDGTEFDSSVRRGQPATFGVTQVIPGWTEALQLMPVGSKWQIVLPSNIAYGPRGSGPIPPNAVLVFEVELLEIVK
ncbi:MAG: FKBP-type peptidyl-prolyl cis-trans isomerase [Pirellulaceae bacterium]|nr:FKBP-type peptidyl-prolyl cis-trans isomerase [Pirellulaceae bacterium]